MDVTKFVREIRETAMVFGATKWELYVLVVLVLIVLRLPTILKHRRELAKTRLEFKLKGKKLEAQIEAEKEKRERQARKGLGK